MPVDVADVVAAHLRRHLGEPSGRASVTFLGTERYEVLRFGPGPGPGPGPDAESLVRYASVGMSRYPMTDPGVGLVDPVRGPRAELFLTLRAARDSVARALAVLAASPSVEGVVVVPGATLDLAEPLWEGAGFTAVLVGEPGGLVPDLPLASLVDPAAEPVRFCPVLPMTPAEAAWKRVHGAGALRERWLARGSDLRDPDRRAVDLS